MRWIGQHIWNLISRFRSDVYLEDLTTDSSTDILVVDSDGKICKNSGAGDDTSFTVAATTTGTGTTITDGDSLTIAAGTGITTTGTSDGVVTIASTVTDTNTMGSGFTVSATTDSNATTITQGDDLMFTAGTGITCETTADGTVTITNTVSDTNTTYSAGDLLDLATTTFNVDLSELTDGTADVVGSADELVYLDAGSQKRKQIDEIKLGQFNNDQNWTSNTGDITGVTITTDSGGGSAASDAGPGSSDFSILGADGVGVTNSGTTITAVAVPGEIDHDSLLNFASNEHFTMADIDSIGTDGDTLAILSDQLTMSNTTADKPTVTLENTADGTNDAAQLVFKKLRDDNGVEQGQNLGEIWFNGQDSAQNSEDYAYIIAEIDVGTSGQESGLLKLGVANHDGGSGSGLILTGGSANDEIDVTLGLGSQSIVTVPGQINQTGVYAATATSDGSGTGTIPDNVSLITVANGGDVNNIIILPTPVVGKSIRLIAISGNYELRSTDPATIAINGGTDTNAESAVNAIANSTTDCICGPTTSYWICSSHSLVGAQTAIPVAS